MTTTDHYTTHRDTALRYITRTTTCESLDATQAAFLDAALAQTHATLALAAATHQAENVAESLTKGMKVIAQGRLTQRSYETTGGEKRTVVELAVEDIGPSLYRASARVTKSGGPRPPAPAADPWAASAAGAGDGAW